MYRSILTSCSNQLFPSLSCLDTSLFRIWQLPHPWPAIMIPTLTTDWSLVINIHRPRRARKHTKTCRKTNRHEVGLDLGTLQGFSEIVLLHTDSTVPNWKIYSNHMKTPSSVLQPTRWIYQSTFLVLLDVAIVRMNDYFRSGVKTWQNQQCQWAITLQSPSSYMNRQTQL